MIHLKIDKLAGISAYQNRVNAIVEYLTTHIGPKDTKEHCTNVPFTDYGRIIKGSGDKWIVKEDFRRIKSMSYDLNDYIDDDDYVWETVFFISVEVPNNSKMESLIGLKFN